MSLDFPHEFSPKAPKSVPTESRGKSVDDIQLSPAISHFLSIAEKRYEEAIRIAEGIDDSLQTSIPFNKNAVAAASLLMLAAVRGAQIS